MQLITLDFETFYDRDYSLSKLTTENYVRHRDFEVIGVAVKAGAEDTHWISGTHEQIAKYLTRYDWGNSMVLAHNTMFDGAILGWQFGITPKIYADTLCMARALHGVESSVSLANLAKSYGLQDKGDEVVRAMGKRRGDFTDEELNSYGDYCVLDVDITHELFMRMIPAFPRKEMKLIDLTLRMFVEPVLDLNDGLLELHLAEIKERKDKLLEDAQVSKEDLMSNLKFAEVLKGLSVKPPMKISLTTGKETFAFAKSDEAFKTLQEHGDDRVQSLVAARLGTKSTLEETRTQRFIDISRRGLLPVPVRYYAAHTGRWGGDDKINLQNLPSRGPNGKKLKQSIVAPAGHTLIDADSAQIEARVLAWLAGQDDLVNQFTNGEDVYKHMASKIYEVEPDEVDKDQRFVGKTTILGAGYGMGAVKFQAQLSNFGFGIDIEEARKIINVYRSTNGAISSLWNEAQEMLKNLENKLSTQLGRKGVLQVNVDKSAIILPSGLPMYYHDLDVETPKDGGRDQYYYRTRRGLVKIYGGKVVENICQAVARCIIGEQMLRIAKKCKVVLTVHDSIVVCVRDEMVPETQAYIEDCMRWIPDWADGLPINCESGTGKSYGDCE
jgi:DNA polymerase I-like protein with 3'-5' exonuclease and polymerase domains